MPSIPNVDMANPTKKPEKPNQQTQIPTTAVHAVFLLFDDDDAWIGRIIATTTAATTTMFRRRHSAFFTGVHNYTSQQHKGACP
jgi:hypothetical protein